jgi:hypothetical protein
MSKISIYHPFNSNTDNQNLLAYLKQIQTVITSSLGPYGKLKLIAQSQNTHINLTNSSKCIIKSLYNFNYIDKTAENVLKGDEYIKWLFDLIQQSIQLQIDNFYDSGLQTIYLINEFYLLHAAETNYQSLIELSLSELLKHLSLANSDCKIKLKLDLENLKHLKILLKTVLNTKTIYRLNITDEKFLNLILKANLNSFQNENNGKNIFSLINYQFYSNNFKLTLNDSMLYNGVLIAVDNLNNLASIENLKKKEYKCVLFDAQLSADFEQFESETCSFELEIKSNEINVETRNVFLLIEKLKSLCDILIANKVDVVLCQKVCDDL